MIFFFQHNVLHLYLRFYCHPWALVYIFIQTLMKLNMEIMRQKKKMLMFKYIQMATRPTTMWQKCQRLLTAVIWTMLKTLISNRIPARRWKCQNAHYRMQFNELVVTLEPHILTQRLFNGAFCGQCQCVDFFKCVQSHFTSIMLACCCYVGLTFHSLNFEINFVHRFSHTYSLFGKRSIQMKRFYTTVRLRR